MLAPRLRSTLIAGCAALVVAATGTVLALSSSGTSNAAAGLPAGFKNVGYVTKDGSASAIQYSKLTHVMYSFARPNADGSLKPIENTAKLSQVVQQGHQNGVKILIAVGGWNGGDDSAFETLAKTAAGRTKLINSLVGVVEQYGLDGVDMDWEYPDAGQSATNFTTLMKDLSAAMKSRGKQLTAAVSAKLQGGGIQAAVFGYVDFLNIMTYDGGTPHANIDWTIDAMTYWKNRGLPKEKAVVGVPLYSRPSYLSLAELAQLDPANLNKDCVVIAGKNECYNGLPTLRTKTKWALANAGGMMMWQLAHDATGANSGLNAIYETAAAAGGGGANLALNKPTKAAAPCTAAESSAKAVNGSVTGGSADKWCSAYGEVKRLEVDFGTERSLSKLTVRHAGAGGESAAFNTRNFTLEVSIGGGVWSTVATITGNTASVTEHSVNASGRWIRISTTDTIARIYEFEAYS